MKYLLIAMLFLTLVKVEAQTTYDNIIYSYDNAGNRISRYKIVTLNKHNISDTINTEKKAQETTPQKVLSIAKTKIYIYPNPTQDILNIDTEEPSVTGTISIIDSKGSVTFVKKGIDNKNFIELSFLSDGLYLIKLDFNGKTEIYSLIKQ